MSHPSNYPRPNPNLKDAELCPQCGQAAGKRLRYTWWGGAIGPSIMSLTKCQACGYQFNAKTGKPVKKAILIYQVVVFTLAFFAGYYLMRR